MLFQERKSATHAQHQRCRNAHRVASLSWFVLFGFVVVVVVVVVIVVVVVVVFVVVVVVGVVVVVVVDFCIVWVLLLLLLLVLLWLICVAGNCHDGARKNISR